MEEKDNVRVMSHEERNDYEGVTIDEQSGEPEDKPQEKERIYFNEGTRPEDLFSFRRVTLKDLLWTQRTWKQRLMLIGGTVAVVGFLIFFALPALAFLAGAVAIAWFLMQLLLR